MGLIRTDNIRPDCAGNTKPTNHTVWLFASLLQREILLYGDLILKNHNEKYKLQDTGTCEWWRKWPHGGDVHVTCFCWSYSLSRTYIQFSRLNERTWGQINGYSVQQSWVRDSGEFASTWMALVSIGHAHPIDLAVNRFKSNKSRGEQTLLDIAVPLSKQIYRQLKNLVWMHQVKNERVYKCWISWGPRL